MLASSTKPSAISRSATTVEPYHFPMAEVAQHHLPIDVHACLPAEPNETGYLHFFKQSSTVIRAIIKLRGKTLALGGATKK